MNIIRPQKGFQTKFLSSSADIVFAGSGAGCFSFDTLVLTKNGHKPIQEIEIGEFVMSYNEKTKQKEYKQVVKTFSHNTIDINKKLIIFTFNNNTQIKCTENHEFYFRGNWIEASELVERKVELYTQNRESVFNFKSWKNCNNKLEKQQTICNNEASFRYKRVLSNNDKNRKTWNCEVFNCKDTSFSIRGFWGSNRREKFCKSYRYEPTKQSYFQFRMVYSKREFLPFIEKYECIHKQLWKQKYIKALERLSNRYFNIKGTSSIGNKSKVHSDYLYKTNVSNGIQCFNRLYKRNCKLQKLETFEINLNNIKKIEVINSNETVYDLSVVDNNNYFVSKDNILVHNCGKSYSLLMEPLRHLLNKPNFGAVIFRRTTPQITNEGGLWDTSVSLYTGIAKQRESSREWIFENGNKLKFSHLEYEKDAYSWQGSQIPFIGFDELTHFTKKQFFYLLSRNRSVCGVKPYVRATLNPDPDSWVADFIEWYIDQSTGFPIKEHIGKLRYFMVNGGDINWGNTKQEVYEKQKHTIDNLIESNEGSIMEDYIKSFTFITGSIYENKELMKANPEYLSNLLAQSEEEQLRLLYGNWKHVTNDNELYDLKAFKDMFGSLKSCKNGKKYITADIAMQGADKYIILVWDGNEAIDIEVIDKTDGKMVLDSIKNMAQLHSVPNSSILYDNDGVGSYLGGFIINGVPFNNNRTPIGGGKKAYTNLKSQCYFESSKDVNDNKYSISDKVSNYRYDKKMTIQERFMYERKAIRKARPDMDNKLSCIRKDEMKPLIGGESPDLMDVFMMRKFFDLGQIL